MMRAEESVPTTPSTSTIWTCAFAQPTPRFVGPRALISICNQHLFDYPFGEIISDGQSLGGMPGGMPDSEFGHLFPLRGDYGILCTLPGQPLLDPGDFPRGISHWIWGDSTHDIDERADDRFWYLLCQLENGLFAFYHADESYTGFFKARVIRPCTLRMSQRPLSSSR